MIYVLDIFGTFVFAVSGAFRAARHQLDLLAAGIVTFVLRVLAMKYGISLPKMHSLPASPSKLTSLRKTKQDSKPDPDVRCTMHEGREMIDENADS